MEEKEPEINTRFVVKSALLGILKELNEIMEIESNSATVAFVEEGKELIEKVERYSILKPSIVEELDDWFGVIPLVFSFEDYMDIERYNEIVDFIIDEFDGEEGVQFKLI